MRPDLVVVCGPPPEEHLRSAPAIVVEIVSQAGHHRDHVHKRDLYGEQGVGAYLIVDPDQRSVMTYRRNAEGEWAVELMEDMFTITICEDREIQVATAFLFR